MWKSARRLALAVPIALGVAGGALFLRRAIDAYGNASHHWPRSFIAGLALIIGSLAVSVIVRLAWAPRSRAAWAEFARHLWSALPLVTAMCFIVPSVILAAGFKLAGSPRWDDYSGTAMLWLAWSLLAAVIIRLLWAVVSPERVLPRWLALVVLLTLAMGAAMIWLCLQVVAAMGGP
jgi:hypothetical protein